MNSSAIVHQVLERPDLYTGVLLDMIQKIGFTAVITLLLIFFLCALIVWLLHHVIKGYTFAIQTLNGQNKRYQDYFLEDRRTSGKTFLGEDTEENKKKGKIIR